MSPAVVQGNSGVSSLGAPDDWTHHHLIFSNPGSFADAARNGSFDAWYRVASDPRYSMQVRKRAIALSGATTVSALQRGGRPTSRNTWWKLSAGTGLAAIFLIVLPGRRRYRATLGLWLVCLLSFAMGCSGAGNVGTSNAGSPAVSSPQPGDWSMTLGNGGKVGAGQYPAKYSFFTSTAPNCASATTPDYVVYNTGLAGSVTQASIVAYDNLYATTCAGTVPSIYWAYNTGGTATTSPIISFSGDQVAFVQSTASVASLVLLKWANSGGTVGAPAAITSVTNANYRTCTAPCYTTIALSGGPNDTNSPPFYVYNGTDTMYVGDNSGVMHKFTNVFLGGTPAESAANGWPVTVSTQASKILTGGVLDPVSTLLFVGDSTGFLYSVTTTGVATQTVVRSGQLAATGSTGIVAPPIVDSTPAAAKVYVFVGASAVTAGRNAAFQFATNFAAATTGIQRTLGSSNTALTVYAGAFDNTHYTGNGTTGNLYVCGGHTGGTAPRLYQVVMNGTFTGAANTFNTPTSGAAACSPVTEILGHKAVTTLSGAMTAVATTASIASGAGTANGDYIQIDSEIMLVTAGGGTTTLTVTRGQLGTAAAAHLIAATVTDIQDWVFLSVSALGTSTGCAGACIYNFLVTNAPVAAAATAGQNATGGTSGIIVDNTSTSTGASQIYYSTLANQACVGNGTTGNGTGGCAVQTLQSAP